MSCREGIYLEPLVSSAAKWQSKHTYSEIHALRKSLIKSCNTEKSMQCTQITGFSEFMHAASVLQAWT